MNLLEIYRQKVVEKSFSEDEHQIAVLEILQNIADGLFLRQKEEKNNRSFIKKILPSSKKNNTVIKGLYCWGGVGRGKTFIMDLFVEYLTQNGIRVNRRHFRKST